MTKIYKKGVSCTYRGVRYRSRWELYTSKLLFYNDIPFLYEPKRFFLTNTLSFLPDYFLPEFGIYLEVKGCLSKKDKILIDLFSRTHRLKYLGKTELCHISGRSASFLSNPQMSKYVPNKEELKRFVRMISN